jgi:hypothetical protein
MIHALAVLSALFVLTNLTAHASRFAVRSMPDKYCRAFPFAKTKRLSSSFSTLPITINTQSIPGLEDDDTRIPPGVAGAVGPSHLLIMHNSQVRIQSRSGDNLVTLSLADFWKPLGSCASAQGPFDPRCQYIPSMARWVASACCDAHTSSSSIMLAVSKSQNPMDEWNYWKIKADSQNALWADYDTMGFTSDKLTVCVNMFNILHDQFVSSRLFVFALNSLCVGSNAPYTRFEDSSMGFLPALTMDQNQPVQYLIQDWSGGAGTIRISTISGLAGKEIFQTGIYYPTIYERWASTAAGGNDIAPQKGTDRRIFCFDSRMQSCVLRNGALWCAQTIFLPARNPTRAAVQWWRISTSGGILQHGRLDDPSGNHQYAFPSIMVNSQETMLMGFTRFGIDEYAGAAFAVRTMQDTSGTLQTETVYQPGEAPYYKTKTSGRNRWGDYTSACLDPVDNRTMWTLQEYAATPIDGIDRWATSWARYCGRTEIWRGYVKNRAAQPVAGARVTLYDMQNQSFLPLSVLSDSDGVFRLPMADIPAGRYHLAAWYPGMNSWIFSPGFQGWQIATNIPAPDPAQITLDPLGGENSSIEGVTLFFDMFGAHLIKAKVHIEIYNGGQLIAETDTDSSSSYIIQKLNGVVFSNGTPWWGWYTAIASFTDGSGKTVKSVYENFCVWPGCAHHLDFWFF